MSAFPTGDTIGEILKRTRESKNLTIETVNRETKISVVMIRALEQDDLESFGSETYLKGFLRNYARYLGLDPDQLWSMLSRQRGDVPDGKGTFWDIEEAVREEKLSSPKIVQRIVIPILIVVIVVLSFLYIKARRDRSVTTGAINGERPTVAACDTTNRGQV
jgi:cytoskeletal protein RodZ